MDIKQLIIPVICLVGVVGAILVVWGVYQEIRASKSGLVHCVVGVAVLGFAGIAIPIATKLLKLN